MVGLLSCLPVALLGAFPAVAGQLYDALPAPHGDAMSALTGPRPPRTVPVYATASIESPIGPGSSVPLDVRIFNPNARAVTTGRVTLKISSIVAPYADASHVCTPLDFEILQMPNRTLRLEGRSSSQLSGLGLPASSWPRLGMRDRPLNQDGCKGALLTLHYRTHWVVPGETA
jgi:hypothetical protein